MNESNEFTPMVRGRQLGREWARAYNGNLSELASIAQHGVAPDLRDILEGMLVGARLVAPDHVKNRRAFWDGFASGVDAFLAEHRSSAEPLSLDGWLARAMAKTDTSVDTGSERRE